MLSGSLKPAALHHQTSALGLDSRQIFPGVIPVYKVALNKADIAIPRYPCYLISRSPEGAVIELNCAAVLRTDYDLNRIIRTHTDELPVSDQKAIGRRFIHDYGVLRAVGSYTQKIAVTPALFCADKVIADIIPIAECIQDIFPVGSTEYKRFAL